jgi:hypothetical protein
MKRSKEQVEKLEHALARAHASQEAPTFSPNWAYAVMRDVRLSMHQPAPFELPRLMWRAATVVAFVSMMVVGSVLAWEADRSDAGFAGLFTETTVDFSLL